MCNLIKTQQGTVVFKNVRQFAGSGDKGIQMGTRTKTGTFKFLMRGK